MLVLRWRLDIILYHDWSTGWTGEKLLFIPWQEQHTSLFTQLSSQALVHTHHPIQWVLGSPFPRLESDQGVKLTTSI